MRRLVNVSDQEPVRRFRDEPLTPVYRRWICDCGGEMKSLGEGVSNTWGTKWRHRCDKCSHEDSASVTYPRVAYLPIETIETD